MCPLRYPCAFELRPTAAIDEVTDDSLWSTKSFPALVTGWTVDVDGKNLLNISNSNKQAQRAKVQQQLSAQSNYVPQYALE